MLARNQRGENSTDTCRTLGKEERFQHLGELAGELMTAIGRSIPVVPVPLVATVFLRRPGERLSELEVKADAFALMRELTEAGAHVYLPRQDQDYAIDAGLRMLTLRHLVDEEAGLFAARPGERKLLAYYAGSIAHLLERPAGGGRGGRAGGDGGRVARLGGCAAE